MPPPSYEEPMRIGDVLKRARTRQGVDIRTVEDRTKIRTKYLRALEAEDWDVLPSPAYAKGFLRTYAQLLGLDADAIVDEFRLQVESKLDDGHPLRLSEPVLEGRRRPGDRKRRPSPWLLIVVGLLAAIGILLVVGVIGGDEEGPDGERRQDARGKQESKKDREGQGGGGSAGAEGGTQEGPALLRLRVESDVQVCLVSGAGEVLIDGQVLSAGTEEQFERDSFELRFPSGYERSQFGLTLNDARVRLPESSARAAFELRAGTPPRELDPPGKSCP